MSRSSGEVITPQNQFACAAAAPSQNSHSNWIMTRFSMNDTARTCCESTARRDEPTEKEKVRRGVAEVSAHAKPNPEATKSKPRAFARRGSARDSCE